MINEDVKEMQNYLSIVDSSIVEAVARLEKRWNEWDIQMNEMEVHEVTGALLARQISLARPFGDTPNVWSDEIAPLILRAMADNFITLNWILQDAHDRCRKFILFGIGNDKLMIERRRATLEEQGLDPNEDEIVKSTSAWISFHRYEFLTTVDVGSWSGISTRQMAIDSGCKDFYDLVYDIFSNYVHSTWNQIGKNNVVLSKNPLHKFLRTPYIPDRIITPHYPDLCIKYLSKSFDCFENKFFPNLTESSILDNYNNLFDEEEN